MTDVLTKAQRSLNMSRIKGRDTRPELEIRRQLRKAGVLNYRVNFRLTGKPDIAFVSERLAVFIDGCFWHLCPTDFKEPETRKAFWMKKIRGNVEHDRTVNETLRKKGWRVERFWEHEVRKNPAGVAASIRSLLEDRPPVSPERSLSSVSLQES